MSGCEKLEAERVGLYSEPLAGKGGFHYRGSHTTAMAKSPNFIYRQVLPDDILVPRALSTEYQKSEAKGLVLVMRPDRGREPTKY
jgi:hypothetical protein